MSSNSSCLDFESSNNKLHFRLLALMDGVFSFSFLSHRFPFSSPSVSHRDQIGLSQIVQNLTLGRGKLGGEMSLKSIGNPDYLPRKLELSPRLLG